MVSLSKNRGCTLPTVETNKTLITPQSLPPVLEKQLRKAVARIVAHLDPEKVILFGSHAYGTPGQDSDVDLLVVMETDKRPAERIVTVSRLLSPRPFPVDIIVRTPDEMERDLKRTDPFIHEVVEKGQILYDRSRGNRRMGRQS